MHNYYLFSFGFSFYILSTDIYQKVPKGDRVLNIIRIQFRKIFRISGKHSQILMANICFWTSYTVKNPRYKNKTNKETSKQTNKQNQKLKNETKQNNLCSDCVINFFAFYIKKKLLWRCLHNWNTCLTSQGTGMQIWDLGLNRKLSYISVKNFNASCHRLLRCQFEVQYRSHLLKWFIKVTYFQLKRIFLKS